MAEEKKTTAAKKAPAKKTTAAKKPAAAKKTSATAAKKTTTKAAATTETKADTKTAAKTATPAKKKPSGKVITITQTGSPIGRQSYQRKTLIGLGLNKLHKTRELEDTPAIRGMINKVKHLVKVEEAA